MRDLAENLDLAKAALNLYEFDPDDTGPTTRVALEETDTETGPSSVRALAGFGEHSAA